MTQKRDTAVFATFVPLGLGHLLAMVLVLVPFALLTWLLTWSREIRIGAGMLVVLFGVSRLLLRRSRDGAVVGIHRRPLMTHQLSAKLVR